MRRHPLGGPARTATAKLLHLALAGSVAVVALGCEPSGGGSPGPTGVAHVLVETAAGERLAFEPAEVTVASTGPLMITFRNGSSQPHNLVFTSGMRAATRTIVEPGQSEQLSLAPPEPGSYPFVCTIHEGMAGTLIVEPGVASQPMVNGRNRAEISP
ncbi:MAG TPA: cupredoxin domain-containing protein [Candidatus Limnocylindrales bacterium]